jgi:hypothetical protein
MVLDYHKDIFMARSSRKDPQFNFRFPVEIREKLELSANKNNRSMTSELLTILEKALSATTPKALDMNAQTQI